MFQHPSPARGVSLLAHPSCSSFGGPHFSNTPGPWHPSSLLGLDTGAGDAPHGFRPPVAEQSKGEVPWDDPRELSPHRRSCPCCTKQGTPRTRAGSCSTSWSVSRRKPRRPAAGKSRWEPMGSCWRAGGCRQHGMLVCPTPTCSEAPDVGTSPILTLHSTSWNKQENPQLLVRC